MSSKLKSITARLVAICKQKRDINLEEKATERVRGRGRPVRDQRVPTTSLPDSHIFGREKDKEALLDLLLATEPSQVAASAGGGGEGVSVIPILGMGGSGKTTLAQLLYDDEKVKVHFDLRAWVCVSQTFDVLSITTAIMQSIGVEIRDDMTLDQLQLKLENFLSGKTFLFVLDDVWREKYEDWCMLYKPLGIGALGSKIIVTTRCQGVATMMGTTQNYCLTDLSYNDCLSIFTHYALGAENFDGYPELKLVGEKIVEKCKGLPLAAKTLGVLLRSKLYYDEWVDVLESSVWGEAENRSDLAEGRSDILPALQLSYDYLTSHFKQCFVYCAIFPNDYKFGMNELVKLWMAEGFLAPLKGDKHPEDVGVEFFEALLSRSFFQLLNRDSKTFYMHELIHDLARHFAGEIFVNMDANLEANEHSPTYQRTRHLSFIQCSHEVLERFTNLFHGNGLRTLLALPVLASNDYNWISNDVLNKLLLKLKQLRALSLSGYNMKEVPEPVSLLKHLRYLNLSKTVIRLLPEFVSSLLNLQTLLLRECKELEKLPMGTGNLSNLCYLDISGTRKLKEMPVGIGNLTGLRSLTKFIVGQGEVDGLNITELKDLSHLQGELSIQGLHNVKDIEDAREADLKGKQGLERLVMEWNHNLEDQVDATVATKVLELLQPHKDLKRLAIQFFSGTEFPSWIGDPLMMSNIVELELCNCVKITSLPPLGKLPVLKHLTVKGMTAVRTLGFEFYGCDDPFLALETLKFEDMLGWEEWCSSLTIAPTHFRSLKNLIVKNVLGSTLLEKICSNLTSLVSLEIEKVSGLTDLPNGLSQNWRNLTDLKIRDCYELTSMVPVDQQLLSWSCCSSFKTIEIMWCTKLSHLPSELGAITSLRNLTIRFCSNLISLPNIQGLTSLLELSITDCYKLTDLPIGLQSSQSLTKLEIAWCPNLKVPALNFQECTSLQSLCINCCGNLSSFPKGLQSLPRLKSLGVGGFLMSERLDYFPSEGLQNLVSIRELRLYGWARVKSLPTELRRLTALQSLTINRFKRVEVLPEWLDSLSSLQSLSLVGCEDLKFFPPVESMRRLSKLTSLRIIKCPQLKERCIAGTGREWPKISHISSIVTD